MERKTGRVRPTRMMDPRSARRRVGLIGMLGTALVFTALAGCGSEVASSGAAGGPLTTTATPPQVGCASVNQATAVSIRATRLGTPVGTNRVGTTYHEATQARALFGQLCAAVTHPARTMLMHCPADMGTEISGTFYDGSRVLATFTFAAMGCERVSVTAAGKTLATMMYGPAAAAAPHLARDLVAIMESPKPGITQPQGTISPS
jgi:hypothetical protein